MEKQNPQRTWSADKQAHHTLLLPARKQIKKRHNIFQDTHTALGLPLRT